VSVTSDTGNTKIRSSSPILTAGFALQARELNFEEALPWESLWQAHVVVDVGNAFIA